MSPEGGGARPVPRVARDRWLDSLTRAGWSARPGSGTPGDEGLTDPRGVELVAVGEALGRVTAAPVAARWPSPRGDCAAMDGIAVRAADLAAAEERPGDGAAVRLAAGSFEWIDTGDPMPAGTDTVVMRERLLPQGDGSLVVTATISGGPGDSVRTRQAGSGRNVRAAGEDFAAGEVLVPAGRRLRPGDLAAAAAGGHLAVAVARRPLVAVIPTGDEIRPLGSALHRGDIIDTNSLMLAARCRQLGAVPSVSPVVPDDPDALAVEIRRAAATADLVLVIAGSSRGRGDHAPAVLAQVGGVAVAGVAVRPGHPAILGHVKRQAASHGDPADPAEAAPAPGDYRAGIAPVIGLPGYPLATAVTFELFAVPMLAALTGQPPAGHRVTARLDRDWSSPADVEDWVLVTLTRADDGGPPLATPARRGASSISQLARSDAWWPIPAGQGTFKAGTQVELRPILGTA